MSGVGIAAGGILATSLVTGYQRYASIQDSIAALTVSLGDATQAALFMEDVLDTVRGTPFNLDVFADAAQRMVSFGAEAEKIPGYLTAIGEVAATKGGRANEFANRLATNFGQIAAMGKITGAEIRELAIAGVPAIQILANTFGVTAEEAQDMVSKGLVPATEAMDALAEGILNGTNGIAGVTPALAGTMEGMRETVQGAMGGVASASARFGATIVEAFGPLLIAGATAAADAFDAVGRAVGPMIESFANLGPIQKLLETIEGLDAAAWDSIIGKLSEFSNVLIPLGAIIGASGLASLRSGPRPVRGVARPVRLGARPGHRRTRRARRRVRTVAAGARRGR